MSLSHWLVVAVLVLLLFGRGKISELMGDMAKGIKSFKQGLAEDDDKPAAPPAQPQTLEHRPQPAAPAATASAQAAPVAPAPVDQAEKTH